MKYQYGNQKITGLAIPLSALISQKSCGIGEFADLTLLAEWCAMRGIKLIQILPIHDTGLEATPYAAQSSQALNPVYLRLENIPGNSPYLPQIQDFQLEHNKKQRVDYRTMYNFKLGILQQIYQDQKKALLYDPNVLQFLSANPWLKTYAVYKSLKEKYGQKAWFQWPENQECSPLFIEDYFAQHQQELFFYIWLQWLLDSQLREAALACTKRGIMLKGDIPILMNKDSVDVWAHREFFDMRYHAGAPPDMYSQEGQNWGFPVYNWKTLKKHNYIWWRKRIAQADRYFHAYRIDHVLGFFRIWQIPETESTGLMGHYHPASYITKEELKEHGFDNGRIRWLTVPHITGQTITNALAEEASIVKQKYLEQIENQDLYLLKTDFASEKVIEKLPESSKIKDFLKYWHRQRTLLTIENENFFPFWYRQEVYSYQSLSEAERKSLEELIQKHQKKSEQLWEEQARELLKMMTENHEMLVCAEDLGVIPECLPQVLADLNILSLRVERWVRDYKSPTHNYIPVREYPELSVATSSVHDSSTLRGWWQEEFDKELYLQHLGVEQPPETELSPQLAEKILQNLSQSQSRVVIIPLQDFLAIDAESCLLNPQEERINIPGTVSDSNWSYRMPMTLETLTYGYPSLNQKIARIAKRE